MAGVCLVSPAGPPGCGLAASRGQSALHNCVVLGHDTLRTELPAGRELSKPTFSFITAAYVLAPMMFAAQSMVAFSSCVFLMYIG